ncbi:MAG: hypothetical protein B6244_14095 [Candidatus Cloacimonetes bacterium 4572_55]|nr:MAG: hypothetical protein B6244_14095 [Candidatus Cloacimonetes bacterium 4572_55]
MDRDSAEGQTEWIELYNRTDFPLNLQDWTVEDGTENQRLIADDLTIFPEQSYLILTGDPESFADLHPDIACPVLPISNWPSLYRGVWGGESGRTLERISVDQATNDSTNWNSCLDPDGATPGERNSVCTRYRDLEATMMEFIPPNPAAGQDFLVRVTATNVGLDPIDNFSATFFIDSDFDSLPDDPEVIGIVDHTFTTLGPGETVEIESDIVNFPTSVLLVSCQLPGKSDQYLSNNRIDQTLMIGEDPVLINEIYYLPDQEADQPEWIECYHQGGSPINLLDWTIEDGTANSKRISTERVVIPTDTYFILTEDQEKFVATYPQVSAETIQPESWPSLNNSGDILAIRVPSGVAVDSLEFDDQWGGDVGVSLERIAFLVDSFDPDNWGNCVSADGSTPGEKNSIAAKDHDLALSDSLGISSSTPLPGESINLTGYVENRGMNAISGIVVRLFHDANQDSILDQGENLASATIAQELSPGESAPFTGSFSLPEIGLYIIGARIDYESDQYAQNNYGSISVTVGKELIVINEIMYSPASGDDKNGAEWVELYLPEQEGIAADRPLIDLQGWRLSDSRIDEFSVITEESRQLYAGDRVILTGDPDAFSEEFPDVDCPVIEPIDGFPSLANSEDMAILYDPTGAIADSVPYLDDWGGDTGRSLERITPTVASTDARNWGTCVAMGQGGTPCDENSIEANLPLRSDVRIETQPNPFSPDNDGFEDHAVITVDLPLTMAVTNLYVYDIQGRLVRRLLSGQSVGNKTTVVWDGADDDGEKVRIGQYILYLEATQSESGKVETEKKRIVVAGRL